MANARRLLLVEDAEEIRASMAELLESEGYRVSVAENGKEALAVLESAAELPELIILDLMMPQMDGRQFRAAQLRDERFSAIPVLLMTAGGQIQATADELGAKGYLKKPYKDIDTIMQVIEQALG